MSLTALRPRDRRLEQVVLSIRFDAVRAAEHTCFTSAKYNVYIGDLNFKDKKRVFEMIRVACLLGLGEHIDE